MPCPFFRQIFPRKLEPKSSQCLVHEPPVDSQGFGGLAGVARSAVLQEPVSSMDGEEGEQVVLEHIAVGAEFMITPAKKIMQMLPDISKNISTHLLAGLPVP